MKGAKLRYLFPITCAIGLSLVSCGGSSRGLSGNVSTFNTVTVYIKLASPNPLESDVIKKQTRSVSVRSKNDNVVLIDNNNNGVCDTGDVCCRDVGPNYPNYQTACCVNSTQKELCVGGILVGDNVNFTFSSQTIRNAVGQPVTPNPSPILVQSYSLNFGGLCITGQFNYSVGAVVPPDSETVVSTMPVTVDMKNGLLGNTNFTFINDDGCITNIANVPSYTGVCSTSAVIEFSLLEINSGIRRNYTFILPVLFADFTTQGECSR